MFNEETLRQLDGPLSDANVKQRQGLDYIEGWFAIQEANRIFGFGNWGKEIVELTHIGSIEVKKGTKKGFHTAYRCHIRLEVRGNDGRFNAVDDVGFGNSVSYQTTAELDTHENAMKEAVTDALKRALKDYGDKFGLTLYDKQKSNVVSEEEAQASETAATVTAEQKKRLKAARKGIDSDRVKELYDEHGAFGDPASFDVEALITALEAENADAAE